jgi:phage-related protein
MPRPPEYSGSFFTIESVVLADGSCPVGEFLDSMDASDSSKIAVLFTMLGDHRRIHNEQKFRKLTDTELWEFKSFQIRILCFFSSDRKVILVHALRKKQDKHRRSDTSIAEERMQWYLSQNG